MMRRLKHPNIIELLEVYEDKNYVYLVMELYDVDPRFDFLFGVCVCWQKFCYVW